MSDAVPLEAINVLIYGFERHVGLSLLFWYDWSLKNFYGFLIEPV